MSSLRQKFGNVYNRFAAVFEPKKKRRLFEMRVKNVYHRVWVERLKGYFMYGAAEFLPYVAAYGLVVNVPLTVLLGMRFNWKTVLSWGLVFYLVQEELTSFFEQAIPYVRVSAKVD